LGHVAGLLFQLGQHNQDALGHIFTKVLQKRLILLWTTTEVVLCQAFSLLEIKKLLDFFQALVSIKTSLPEIKLIRDQEKPANDLLL